MGGSSRSKGKVIPWVGIVADFDGHYGSQISPAACQVTPQGVICSSVNASVTEHNYLFGPRVSASVGKFRPFAEVMIGGAHVNVNNGGGSDTSFATAVGGGIDYKIFRPACVALPGRLHTDTLLQYDAEQSPPIDRHRSALLSKGQDFDAGIGGLPTLRA